MTNPPNPASEREKEKSLKEFDCPTIFDVKGIDCPGCISRDEDMIRSTVVPVMICVNCEELYEPRPAPPTPESEDVDVEELLKEMEGLLRGNSSYPVDHIKAKITTLVSGLRGRVAELEELNIEDRQYRQKLVKEIKQLESQLAEERVKNKELWGYYDRLWDVVCHQFYGGDLNSVEAKRDGFIPPSTLRTSR